MGNSSESEAVVSEAASELFALSLRLLQAGGEGSHLNGYKFRQPLDEPIGNVLHINATFDVHAENPGLGRDLRVSLSGDDVYVAVSKEGKFKGHSKGMSTTVREIEVSKVDSLREITAGVAAELLGGQV